jgi:5-bromo-4-chloroindolyl phosphate hydrolysis protein
MADSIYIYSNSSIKLLINSDTVGYYLIIYKNPHSLNSTEDYLYDSLDDAFQAAEEKFHVPKTQWKRLQ